MRAGRLALVVLALVALSLGGALLQRSRFAREAFAPGDRVRVAAGGPAAGETGTVTLPPLPVAGAERGWSGHVRRGGSGEPRFWVTLDRAVALGGPDTAPTRGVELPASALVRQAR